MGAVEELQLSGRLDGHATFRLLRVSFVHEARRLPALAPRGFWTSDDLDDLFGDFVAAKLMDLTDGLRAAATTEAAVRNQAHKIAKNWLIDRLRTRSDAGSTRHTLEKLLADDRRFNRSPGLPHYWSLVGVADVSTAPIGDLVVAARAVSDVPPGRPAGENRRASLAPLADLARVLEAVLVQACGAVEIAVLTHVLLVRFDVAFQGGEVTYDDDVLHEGAVPAHPGLRSEQASEVQRVLGTLTDHELRILPLLDDHQAIQAELGVKKSQASLLNGRLRVVLAGLTPEVEDQARFVTDLIAAADERRTNDRSVRLARTDGAANPERSS